MRLPTSTKLALALAALLAAACQQDTITSPEASCRPTGAACGENADCCSYGCVAGTCLRNPLEGGMCRNTDDCGFPRVCVANHCTSEVQCRVDGDTCDFANDCCSGLCRIDTNTCAPDRAPVADAGADVTVPRHVLFTLSNASADPDGTTLEYTWSLAAPAGSTAALSSTTAAIPSFTPDVSGVYQATLTVSDGFLTATDVIVVTAVNTVPAVTLTPATLHRNVPFTATGTVADADGDPLTCTWTVTAPPGGTSRTSGPSSCTGSVSFGFTPDAEGDWTVALDAFDGVNHSVDPPQTMPCVNDAPVAIPGPRRVGNLGETAASTPPIALHGDATDANGDVGGPGFTWTWTVVSNPACPDGTVLATTQDAELVPDQEGRYTLKLHVEDGFGGAHEEVVAVDAYRYVRPVLSATGAWDSVSILDATYLKASDRIVLLGTDSSGATPVHRVWVVDPAAAAADPIPTAVLGAAPTCLSVSADGTTVLVGEQGAHWQLVTGLPDSPTAGALRNGPFTPNDVVYVSATEGFAFGSTGIVYRLDLVNGTYAPPGCFNCTYTTVLAGTRATGRGSYLWMLDEARDTLARWYIRPNGELEQVPATTVSGQASTDQVWLSADGVKLFTSTGASYVAATLASDASLPIVPTHVDTSVVTVGGTPAIAGIAARSWATELTRFDAGLQASGTLPLPELGVFGGGYQAHADHAFLSSDGSQQFAIVQAQVPTAPAATTLHVRWGIVTYP